VSGPLPAGDENVRRLEVAVHDHLLMRVGHRIADLKEKPQPLPVC
jgi:hypothetical protein